MANYDADMFDSVEEENAYVLRQLAFFKTLPSKATTEAGWLAFKMTISQRQAERKIARAQAARKQKRGAKS